MGIKNAAATVLCCMGFDVLVYGDRDSVMFCILGEQVQFGKPLRSYRTRPIQPYIDYLWQNVSIKEAGIISKYISDSKGSSGLCPNSCRPLRGVVQKIINIIMSFTCITELKIEHNTTNCILDRISNDRKAEVEKQRGPNYLKSRYCNHLYGTVQVESKGNRSTSEILARPKKSWHGPKNSGAESI